MLLPLLKVTNDTSLPLDSGSHVVFVLLDLSAAFYMIDHEILLNHLECWVYSPSVVCLVF